MIPFPVVLSSINAAIGTYLIKIILESRQGGSLHPLIICVFFVVLFASSLWTTRLSNRAVSRRLGVRPTGANGSKKEGNSKDNV